MTKITIDRAVVEQALEALELLQNAIYNIGGEHVTGWDYANYAADSVKKPINALKAALADPQEPCNKSCAPGYCYCEPVQEPNRAQKMRDAGYTRRPTLREMAEPQEPWEHLKHYGYAPGNYMSRCHICDKIASGVDKRAITCRPCAEVRYAESPSRAGAGAVQR